MAARGSRRGDLTRRGFLRTMGAAGAAGAAGPFGLFGSPVRALAQDQDEEERGAKAFKDPNDLDRRIASARGDDPYAVTVRAVEMLGGMGKLVSEGDLVCVKPNAGWEKSPKVAANTNPAVVAAIVGMCVEAGAREVRVLDMPAESVRKTGRLSVYDISGIEAAVEEEARRAEERAIEARASASPTPMPPPTEGEGEGEGEPAPREPTRVVLHEIVNSGFRKFSIPGATHFPKFGFYVPAVECDVFINVPVLKTHGGVGASIGLKNLMGIIDKRKRLHKPIQEGIVDINRLVRVDLTIVDAWKGMLSGGPRGKGNSRYKDARTVAAGVDRVAVDSYGLHVMGRRHDSVAHIRLASDVIDIPGGEKGTSDWRRRGLIEEKL